MNKALFTSGGCYVFALVPAHIWHRGVAWFPHGYLLSTLPADTVSKLDILETCCVRINDPYDPDNLLKPSFMCVWFGIKTSSVI
uniref:Uncharacterized protein n=1 Tax=Timema genevievae TaxID=629358 RepID=A0A7R9PHQ8_TIMGE|nr:unnamed protein product [Timema genevievae]